MKQLRGSVAAMLWRRNPGLAVAFVLSPSVFLSQNAGLILLMILYAAFKNLLIGRYYCYPTCSIRMQCFFIFPSSTWCTCGAQSWPDTGYVVGAIRKPISLIVTAMSQTLPHSPCSYYLDFFATALCWLHGQVFASLTLPLQIALSSSTLLVTKPEVGSSCLATGQWQLQCLRAWLPKSNLLTFLSLFISCHVSL